MPPTNNRDETSIPTDEVEDELNDEDLADDEDEDEERPDDAVDCPQCDQWSADPDCSLCGGRRWVYWEDLDAFLGDNRVRCLECGGEGQVDSFGPCSFSCHTCLGTGMMPVAELAQSNLNSYPITEQDWSGVDLRGVSLGGAVFESCDFSRVNLDSADLSGTRFLNCNFTEANPERAASLEGTVLQVEGLSEEQIALCLARGATTEDLGPGE
jgi:hypothetical protein